MSSTVPLHAKLNVYGAITAKIVRAMKDAKGTYRMPWHAPDVANHFPTNAATDNPYRGVNIISLWADSVVRRFPTGHWASYKQWQSLGAQVRRGEHGSIIIFYRELDQTELEKAAGEHPRAIGRATWVFNAAQVDNWQPPPPKHLSPVEIDKVVEAFVRAIDARVEHGYPMAKYRIDLDRVEMPSPAWFFDSTTSTASQAYHAVLLHELTHWTGAAHRIGRDMDSRFGDHAYAFEELVAELGAAFMCSAFKIANEPRQDHAAYLANWLEVLENDPKAIFTAASRAQEAIEYLVSLAA